ncbi:unnamed protein product [Linum tenue]|uniref:Uncharacterized protein n=1 Tax=Linum tenue TaxID=586396 RepID=A0AAV0LD54_9ROSI|nr:unnamed protein product [Linum tenue]CAI0432138.1 unnamed protein product [Linum tenue]
MEPISLNRQGKSLPLSSSSQSVKKATKFIAPIIFFFVLFQHSDCVFPLVIELSSTVVDKNYMFILCNWILVLIARSSGLIGNGGKKKVADFKSEMEVREKVLEEATEEEVIAVGERREEGKDCSFVTEEVISEGEREEDDENCSFMTGEVGGCDEEKHIDGDSFVEVGQGEEKNGLLSGEELQRKCEDFIRKMKAGIKFEAQQQQQQLTIVQ